MKEWTVKYYFVIILLSAGNWAQFTYAENDLSVGDIPSDKQSEGVKIWNENVLKNGWPFIIKNAQRQLLGDEKLRNLLIQNLKFLYPYYSSRRFHQMFLPSKEVHYVRQSPLPMSTSFQANFRMPLPKDNKRQEFNNWGGKRDSSNKPFKSWGGKRNENSSSTLWGGKRNADRSFTAWGGKRNVDRSFTSWGGKRNADRSFTRWGGKRNVDRSFTAWGGKRNADRSFKAWGGKRNADRSFTRWGGKRNADRSFTSWGGKRSYNLPQNYDSIEEHLYLPESRFKRSQIKQSLNKPLEQLLEARTKQIEKRLGNLFGRSKTTKFTNRSYANPKVSSAPSRRTFSPWAGKKKRTRMFYQ